MTHKPKADEYDEYTSKIMNIQKITLDYDKKKYNMILEILKAISILFGKRIKYLSDFKNISCILLQENFQDIKDIFDKNKENLESNFGIKVEFKKSDDYKKFICIIRNMVRNIDYKIVVRGEYVTITHV